MLKKVNDFLAGRLVKELAPQLISFQIKMPFR
jgi:hypothetical protein